MDLNPQCITEHGRNLVGFSGGPDSLCLLRLLGDSIWRPSVVPVHIDHGLDPDSARRAASARQLAAQLGFECRIERVAVDPDQHGGPAAAARHARYRRFEQLLDAGDHLLTAHHADDQVETVLLRLLRGAGPEGLAGMRPLRRLGAGWLGRPMLHWSRTDILQQLRVLELKPIQDPTNAELAADRNYLRHRILPQLEQRWPAARRALLQAAQWQVDAVHALRLRADCDLARSGDGSQPPETLRLQSWLQLERWRALAALRRWYASRGLESPRQRMLEEFHRQCSTMRPDRQPRLDWNQAALLAWNDRIWLETDAAQTQPWAVRWGPNNEITLPDGSRLRWRGIDRARLGTEWLVTSAAPGDRLVLHRNGPGRRLVDLLREQGIPPWRRLRLPCIRIDGQLRAVAALLFEPALAESMAQTGSSLEWQATAALLSSDASSNSSPPQ